MPVAGEVVQLNPDGTVPEGAYYNPAAGVAMVIPGGILDTGDSPSTTGSGDVLELTPIVDAEGNTVSSTDYDSGNFVGVASPGNQGNVPVTTLEAMQGVYVDKLGRTGTPENVINWVNAVNAGQMTFDEAVAGIANSAEGQAYAASQAAGADANADANADADADTGMPGPPDGDDVLDATTNGAPPPVNTNFNPLIQQYYQELFNRQAQQPGLDYFSGRLGSGALTEEGLRDAIISGATGTDKLYYDSSQAYGPVFDATQSLFGRRPARGRYNPETGQLEGGFGQYRRQLDAGELTPEQLRGRLVQLAYNRGEGGGQSGDYQNYLNTLGIDRANNPFLQDDGTYANVAYGSDLSQYQPDPGMPAPPPGSNLPLPGEGTPFPMPGPTPPRMPGKGGGMPGRMPGQYITGNQLYSGMPYGMSQPMGMFAQPMIYQPPQFSEQYMPNRGLMSGYSTGFGPYGGYRRPRFGGGKGGLRTRPIYPMGGGKGGFGGGFGY